MAINLLSPKEKRAVRSMYRTHRLIAILMVADLLLLSSLVLIGALHVSLRQDKLANQDMLAALRSEAKVVEFNKLRDEVNLTAKYTKLAKQAIAQNEMPSLRLEEVFTQKTKGIRLTSFDYIGDKKSATVHIKGVAASRQNLLEFTSKLETLAMVKNVDSPVANLVGDTNAPFTLTLELIEQKTNE